MSTKSCIDCREKDSENDSEKRDLKEKVVKLEMEKAKLIHQVESLGYRSSSRSEDIDTSESEYLDDSDDDDWVPESEEKEKPVKKRICRTSVASNLLDTDCCSCSKNSSCKTMRCPCQASGGRGSCGALCACLSRKCANGRTVLKDLGGSPEFQIHEFLPPD